MERLYRYTANGEGIWAAGKRMLPDELVNDANEARKWLPRLDLPEGEYRFYLTDKGKRQYEATLLKVHEKYLSNIELHEIDPSTIGEVVYKDEWQVVANGT